MKSISLNDFRPIERQVYSNDFRDYANVVSIFLPLDAKLAIQVHGEMIWKKSPACSNRDIALSSILHDWTQWCG